MPKESLNNYECGCQIRHSTGDGYFIEWCPMHKTASDLLEALINAADECEEYADIAKPPIKRRIQKTARQARAAIARAQGTPQ